jgi:hypothetical protein
VRALPVALNEKLRKTKAAFQKRSAIAKGSLQRLPQCDALVRERDNLYPHEAFADGLPVSNVPAGETVILRYQVENAVRRLVPR